MSKRNQSQSANDQRSNVKNPNNAAYEADRINRERQAQESGSSSARGGGKS